MKKIILLATITVALSLNSFAQISAGGGLAFGTEAETVGINLRGQYSVTENIDAVAGFTFFFPKTTKQSFFTTSIETKTSMWSLDFDGHYNFAINDQFKVYPLAGLNITGVSVDVNGTKNSDTEAGLNIGAGATYGFSDQLKAFAETKYTIGNFDQAVITLGVLFSF